MKIQDAKKAYAAQMDTLWTRKRDLSQALKNCQQGGAPNVDRVEISVSCPPWTRNTTRPRA